MKVIKEIFKSNFSNLSDGKLINLNESTIKVMASYEDGEGGFDEAEVILDNFNNKIEEQSVEDMLEAIEEGWLEVDFKKQNDDYIITAGNNEVVYVASLQVFRVK